MFSRCFSVFLFSVEGGSSCFSGDNGDVFVWNQAGGVRVLANA